MKIFQDKSLLKINPSSFGEYIDRTIIDVLHYKKGISTWLHSLMI